MTCRFHVACALTSLWLAGASFAQSPLPAPPAGPAADPAGSNVVATVDPAWLPLPTAALPMADTRGFAAEDAGLAAYVDGLVEGIRARAGIAGVIVAVVKDDRVMLATGHGDAVIEPRRPADGDTTMFRIGSISKTFTYTAAMQLVERGVLTLDDPVNQHLPEAIRVPDDGFAEPVLVRHLLTHTAGFEDRALGHLFVRDPALDRPLDEYLARHRPARVRAPGVTAIYSNYSVALLGALVAHVSGLPFERYVEQHLTGPLAMRHTSFREPLTEADARRIDPALAADIATGYRRAGGTFVAGEFEYIAHGAPAGSASSTAIDMARWMRVHLNGGELDGVRILSNDNTRRMRDILFRNAPDVAGIGHGFLTDQYGPYAAYGHGGATLYFHSGMALLPDRRLGVFVSANTDNARAPVRDLVRLIIEHLLPDARPTPVATPMTTEQLARVAGTYRGDRRPHTTAEKLVLSLGSDLTVTPAGDSALRIDGGSEPTQVVATGPISFQSPETGRRIQFLADASGAITGFADGSGIATFSRVAPLERAETLYVLLGLTAFIAVARLAPRRAVPARKSPRPGLGAVKALTTLAALIWLAFVVMIVVAAVTMASQGSALVYTYPTQPFLWALGLATAAAAVTALELVAIFPVLRSRWHTVPKLRYLLGVALLSLTVYVLWTWHLIGMTP